MMNSRRNVAQIQSRAARRTLVARMLRSMPDTPNEGISTFLVFALTEGMPGFPWGLLPRKPDGGQAPALISPKSHLSEALNFKGMALLALLVDSQMLNQWCSDEEFQDQDSLHVHVQQSVMLKHCRISR